MVNPLFRRVVELADDSTASADPRFRRVLCLADGFVSAADPQMRWMWGEALLGFALLELDEVMGEDRYLPFLKAYCDHWAARAPRVDQSDTAAPGLVTYGVQKKLPGRGYERLTEKVLSYIRNAPRVLDDSPNHLGSSPEGRFYPKSIWVDSLMMLSLFPAVYGAETGDRELLDFAARQPRLYAARLQDPADGLWRHSWWVRAARPHPSGRVYWARGNGWVVASLPRILDRLPPEHPERSGILEILERTSRALLPLQRPDGWWETVLLPPGRSYRESSATALIAAGWLHSAAAGYLPEGYRAPAEKAFRSVVDSLVEGPGGRLSMPEISAPTIPLPAFPRLGYRLVPRGSNYSYGVAALVLAAVAWRRPEDSTAASRHISKHPEVC